jgi:hypothetical protein
MIKQINEIEVDKLIKESIEGNNTKFIKNSHNLWLRFKNYEKQKPFGLFKNGRCVSIIFATISNKTKYVNLYEICTKQGEEKKGYAREIWSLFIEHCFINNMQRIKLSCTPSSIGWHINNGLVFWSVDKSGSLRSDQPLKRTISEQIELRAKAVINPKLVIPSKDICLKLKTEELEKLNLSKPKAIKAYEAIKFVDKYWLRNYLDYGLQT